MELPKVEGPHDGRDISYNYFYKQCEDLNEIEEGIPVSSFSNLSKMRNKDLEFRLMRKITETKKHMEFLVQNTPKLQGLNRYSDILPYQDTIVSLESGDYINADWIKHPMLDHKLFIATQGPLESTRDSFWRMVWEYSVSLIIMISAIREAGKVKCDQYFPIGDPIELPNFVITPISSETPFPSITSRDFQITHKATMESRNISHLQSVAWPDHGTPELEDEFDSIDYLLNSLESHKEKHVVVHCSAGIGRTGTLIALFQMVQTIKLMKEDARISVFGTVRRLREQRWGMVQTKDQYDFLYRFMDEWLNKYHN